MKSNVFIFSSFVQLMSCVRNRCLTQGHNDLFLHFLLRALQFQLLYFDLEYILSEFLYMVLGKGPTLNYLGTFVENHLTMNERVYFQTLNSIPLVFIFVILCQYQILDYSHYFFCFHNIKKIFYWCIVDLLIQCCVSFRCTAK